VLRALGRDVQLAQSSLRFSLGRFTEAAEVDFALTTVREALARLRALSPAAAEALGGAADEWRAARASGARLISGEAGAAGQDTWIRFELLVAGDIVKDARFKAFACPHTMDVAAWLCGELRGRDVQELIPGAPLQWGAARGVPAEKLGRLLLIEDALRACRAHGS
jgi:hypothetical protein